MKKGNISVQTENIFPIIKKFLYSDHEIFLRELVSNAVDACQKVITLSRQGEIKTEEFNPRVIVRQNTQEKTITISDNGIGMSAEEVEKYINQIAFSGAEEFVSKYKDAQIIGHFGLGFYSAFMVAKEVEIISKSHKENSQAVRWVCDGSPEYSIEKHDKESLGTDIILHLADDSLEFNEESRLMDILEKYCRFMPVEIEFGIKSNWIDHPENEKDEKGNVKRVEVTEPRVINSTTPLWTKKPSDLQDEDYKQFYHQLYPSSFEEPLFQIHINVDYPFNLTGILFFPQVKTNFEIQKNKIQLYCNQVFITDEVKNILPDFLTLLHGVIDSPDIPLNVSRSYLQADGNVKKISSHITKKVGDKLSSMFTQDRKDFESKWDDISLFIHYGSLTEEKFSDKASGFSLFKNHDGLFKTLEEWKEAIGDTQIDKHGNLVLLYSTDEHTQHAAIERVKERGWEVFQMNHPLTAPYLSHLESKNEKITFKRVDSAVPDKLIEKEVEISGALSEEQKEKVKTNLNEWINDNKFKLEFENMSPNDPPLLIIENEFMRRMKEQQALGGGGGFFGAFPESYDVRINTNHPVVQNWEDSNGQSSALQALALAKLSSGLLKGIELSNFVKMAFEKMQTH